MSPDVVLPAIVPLVVVVALMVYRGSFQSAAYLSLCMGLCFALIYVSLMDFSQPTKESEATLPELVAKFHLDVTEMRESLKLLSALKKRVSGSGPRHAQAAREASDLGLLKYALAFVQNLEAADSRIPICCDIINALLSQVPIRTEIHSDEFLLNDTTDTLLQAVKAMSLVSAEEAKSASTLNDIDEDEDMTRAIEEDFLLPAPKKLPNEQFPGYGSKFIMAIVSLSMDNLAGQTVMGDRGAIPIVIDVLRTYGSSSDVTKWCCAALFNITFEHPPNKREFYEKGGLVLAIDALKRHPKNPDVYQQCLALIVSILQIDPHTKMNQSKSRHTALAANIVEALQDGKREFKAHKTIITMMDQIDQILIMDWS